jgi:N-acetylmuramoyl-L-alanine amidase
MTVGQVMQSACATAGVKGLDLQVIHTMNTLVPGLLVPVAHAGIFAPSTVHLVLQRAAHDALIRARERVGNNVKLTVNSCYRTVVQQVLLYNWYLDGRCDIPLAAKPGRSNHEDAAAIDITSHLTWKGILTSEGWVWQGASDKVHFAYRGHGFRDDVGKISIRAFQHLWNQHRGSRKALAEDGVFGHATSEAVLFSPAAGFGQ